MGPAEGDMGYLLSQTSRALRTALAEGLRNHGLDDAAYILLYYVERAGEAGETTVSVATTLQMPLASLDMVAERLVRDGWITASPDPKDRDSRRLFMTRKAAAVVPVLEDAAHWAIERALSGFSGEEITLLTGYLERMRSNLR